MSGALEGITVLDVSTMLAGPLTATMLSDFGAEVIKIEHPRGDPQRTHGPSKNGQGLWWKVLSRNKKCVTIDLSGEKGQLQFSRLVQNSDVVIENFRPGVMQRWNLDYENLLRANGKLVLLHVTGFGQNGPYSHRPGFGTLAEAMSGFAYITGEADGPPTLPPFGLADGVAGIAGAYAVMLALFHRERTGMGQEIDLSLIEPLFRVLGPQPTLYDQLGIIQERNGNRGSGNNAPRNTYMTRDGHWVAVSTSADSIAARCMRLVGHPEVISNSWFLKGETRAQHADELDGMVGSWIADRPLQEVMTGFEAAEVAIAPVYDIEQIMADPHFAAIEAIKQVVDEDLGAMKMQNVMFRMSRTPGEIRWTGRALGADNAELL